MYYGQVLKTHTREVLYEKFRTEKLLARRATRKIGEEQTKKLFQGAFFLHLPTLCSALTPHSDLGL